MVREDICLCVKNNVLFAAENECTSDQKLQCDGGSNSSICAVDSVNGTDIICQCPKGYALNSTKYCVGMYFGIFVLSLPGQWEYYQLNHL